MAKFATTVTIDCPHCGDSHVVKDGKDRKGKQRYRCRACGKWFGKLNTPPQHRFSANHIGAAIRMFYSGVSYKQIGENMEEQYDIPEPAKSTIYHWVKEYTPVALKAMKDHKAHTGPEWVVDEMVVKVGGEKYWNWNVMDSKTRYILASHLSKGRTARDARAVLRKARGNAANLPKTIKTDKLKSYIDAIEREFGADVKHVQSEGLRAKLNNNLSERLQGTFRSRTKTMRGLDGKASGQLYLDGWVLNYNLFRDHESLRGRTPAEAAEIQRPFDSWEGVVSRSARPVAVLRDDKPTGKPGTQPELREIPKLPASASRPKLETVAVAPSRARPRKSKTNGQTLKLPRTTAYHPYLRKRERRKGRK